MSRSFWKSTLILFKSRRRLALAVGAMSLSALGFGASLGLFLPAFQLLLAQGRSAAELADLYLNRSDRPAILSRLGETTLALLPSDRFWAFVVVMGAICGIGLVSSLAAYCHELLATGVILRATHLWRRRIFRHVLALPLSRAEELGPADCLSRLVSDTSVLGQGYAALLGKTAIDMLKASTALVVALLLDWRLATLTLVGALPVALLMRRIGKSARRASTRVLEQSAGMLRAAQEALLGLSVLKAHQAEGFARRRFDQASRSVLRRELRARRLKAVGSPAVEIITLCGVAFIACLAAWFVFRRQVAPADALALLLALSGGSQSLRTLGRAAQKVHEADAAAARLYAVLETPRERLTPSVGPAPSLPRHSREIRFDNVSFTYPNRILPALDSVDLRLEYGQTVALVGPNGAGKSSLVNLLPRLLDPDRGRVLIDGINVASARLSSLRRQIAMVPQRTVLFEGSIARNIAFGLGASRRAIELAGRRACAHDFIMGLPHGYDTRLGELGGGLSEGQKQRLAIARALLRNPAILILDEATSQIDIDSENRIHDVLRALAGTRTLIVIAHRLGTITLADTVVIMNEGKVLEVCSSAKLVSNPGLVHDCRPLIAP
jgi:subfamily B ATP-binding cassette protein MsbA